MQHPCDAETEHHPQLEGRSQSVWVACSQPPSTSAGTGCRSTRCFPHAAPALPSITSTGLQSRLGSSSTAAPVSCLSGRQPHVTCAFVSMHVSTPGVLVMPDGKSWPWLSGSSARLQDRANVYIYNQLVIPSKGQEPALPSCVQLLCSEPCKASARPAPAAPRAAPIPTGLSFGYSRNGKKGDGKRSEGQLPISTVASA